MLKKLQQQIEQEKKELIKPIQEKFEQIFTNYEVSIDFDLEGTFANANFEQKTENSIVMLNFTLKEQERTFTNFAVKYEIQAGLILAAKPSPFSIDQNVLNFVFYELNNLLKNIQPKESEDEIKEEN